MTVTGVDEMSGGGGGRSAGPDGARGPYRATSRAVAALGLVALVAVVATVVLGLRLPPTAEQAEYSRLIAIHPPLAWIAYLAFGVVAVASALVLATGSSRWDRVAASSAEIGVVFTALMLVTGSIWGRPTWGVWWVWDARLTLSALMLVLLLGYLALRRVATDPDRRARLSAVAGLGSALVVPVNHFAVSWWRTLHQGRSLARPSPQSELDGAYIQVMLLGLAAMTLVYGWLLAQRVRVARLEQRLESDVLRVALAERRAESSGPTAAGHGTVVGDAVRR